MPPFYDASTRNALTRLEFWLVAVATGAGFIALWGMIIGWRHTRRLTRWVRTKLAR